MKKEKSATKLDIETPVSIAAYRRTLIWSLIGVSMAALVVELGPMVRISASMELSPVLASVLHAVLLVTFIAPIAYIFIYLPQLRRLSRLNEGFSALQSLYHNTLDGIIVADAQNTGFLEVNDTICRILGYSRDELLALSMVQLHPLDALPEAQEIFVQMVRDEVDVASELPFVRKDGNIVYLDIRARKIMFAGRQCLIGFFRDVTGRREVEHMLIQSEARYRALFNTAPLGVQLSDTHGIITYSNPAHHRILGYGDEELVGRYIWDFVTDESESQALKAYYEMLVREAPEPGTVHVKNRTKDGRVVDVQVNWDYIRNGDGKVVEICSIISDITEKRSMEERLKERERLFRAILESTSAVPWELDAETWRFNYVGPQAERLLGYPPEQWKDFDYWLSLVHPDDRAEAKQFCEESVKRKADHEFEYRMIAADGRTVWIRDIVTVIAGNGGPMLLRGFLFDITELKEAEDQLRRSEASLAEAQRIAHIGSWEWDIVNDTLVWSDEVYRIFGREPQEFGASFEAFLGYVHPQDRDMVIKAVDEAVNENKPYRVEHRILLSSGEIRYVLEQGESKHGESRNAVRMLGTVQDVTELRETERSLQESQQMLRTILDAIPVRVFWKDRDLNYLGCNRVFAWDAGFEFPEDIVGKNDLDMAWAAMAEDYRNDDREVIQTERQKLHYLERQSDTEGRVSWLRTSKIPLRNADGDLIGVLGTYEDITESVKAEKALRESQEGLATAQRIARMGSWHWDVEENEQFWSDEIYRIFDLAPQATRASYAEFIKYVHPDDRNTVMQAVSDALEQKRPYSIEHRIITDSGEIRIVREEGEVEFGPQGTPLRMVGTVQDITERRAAEEQMQKLSMALEESINIIYITDREGRIEYVNPKFEEITGYEKDEVIGKEPSKLGSVGMDKEAGSELWATILAGRPWRGVLSNRDKEGKTYWANTLISPLVNELGEIMNFLVFQEDITETVVAKERLKYLSEHDEVTGLLNRAHFIDLLEDSLSSNGSGALILVDIDEFKLINDKYGSATGDEVLLRMGGLINEVLKEYSPSGRMLLSRPGEDEFALFVPGLQRNTASNAVNTLRDRVGMTSFTRENIHITASIGVVLIPEHGFTREDVLKKVDAALIRAKQQGQGRTHIYSPDDKILENMHLRLESRERILDGLNADQFEPWFQPILNLETGETHYEALARLQHNDEILLPGEFLNTAEIFGLIGSIDRQVIKKTIERQAQSIQSGTEEIFSMNLSGKNISEKDMLDFIKQVIKQSGANPEALIFEITETAAIQDFKRAIAFIKELKDLGCRFSLDDFGVGFTSFVYLTELNVDFIKIDGSFIRRLHEHPRDQLVVRAIVDVARGLGIKTVAEFVETRETLELLKEYRVNYAQGYFIGKPQPQPIIPSMV